MRQLKRIFKREAKCQLCGIDFLKVREYQKFCSDVCRSAQYNSQFRHVNRTDKKIPTGTTGTISELLVAADLLKSGYEVFRALSPSCSCDLAILKNGKLIRVEVTTAYIGPSGKLLTCKKPNEKSDIIAYVLKAGNEIIYEPPLND